MCREWRWLVCPLTYSETGSAVLSKATEVFFFFGTLIFLWVRFVLL